MYKVMYKSAFSDTKKRACGNASPLVTITKEGFVSYLRPGQIMSTIAVLKL
jgi:hypothetical protein